MVATPNPDPDDWPLQLAVSKRTKVENVNTEETASCGVGDD